MRNAYLESSFASSLAQSPAVGPQLATEEEERESYGVSREIPHA